MKAQALFGGVGEKWSTRGAFARIVARGPGRDGRVRRWLSHSSCSVRGLRERVSDVVQTVSSKAAYTGVFAGSMLCGIGNPR